MVELFALERTFKDHLVQCPCCGQGQFPVPILGLLVLFHIWINDIDLGLGVPSAGFQVTPSWVVQLTSFREGVASREAVAGLRSGSTWTSTRPYVRSCTLIGTVHRMNTVWVMYALMEGLWRKTGNTGEYKIGHEPAMCACSPESPFIPMKCDKQDKEGGSPFHIFRFRNSGEWGRTIAEGKKKWSTSVFSISLVTRYPVSFVEEVQFFFSFSDRCSCRLSF